MDAKEREAAAAVIIQQIRDEMRDLHAEYMRRYADLQRRQTQILKSVMERADAEKAKRLSASLTAEAK
ncbi:MAG: hypothetical protein PHT12_01830 [Patescibacteria group bacterium]|nr:hypothetical protein [Patescibacteria group bacterium]